MIKVSRGYTLIEILIALSITALIFGLGYVGYRDFSRRQLVNSAAQTLVGDLRLAQEQSIAGKKPTGCVVLDGYKVFVDVAAKEYTISANCSDQDYLVKTVSISPQIVLTAPTTNPIIFRPIGLGTNIPMNTSVTIVLSHPGINYSNSVTIGSGGDIQ